MASICRHCFQRIVKVNFALGESWMHQPSGASFNDGMYEYCHLRVAEPADDEEEKNDRTVPPPAKSRK
jgi:hypothetical protein